MSDRELEFTVVDDSGLLSLVDCFSYKSFLSEHWTYETIVDHFNREMARKSILVWECGDGGGPYSVKVAFEPTGVIGFREATGPIIVTKDRLQIVSYDSLTMAAQFDDEALPSKREAELAIPLAAGEYKVRLVQTFDPKRTSETPSPHFVIEIEPGNGAPWSSPTWIQL